MVVHPRPPQGAPAEERSRRHLEVLSRVGRSLLESLDLDVQLGLALSLAKDALGAERGSIMLRDGEQLTIRVSEGLPEEATRARIRMGEGIAGWVAAYNEPVVLHGGVDDPRFTGRDPSIESALSLPLSTKDGLLGVLNIVRVSGERFTQQDLTLATAIADLSSLAIEKSHLYLSLRDREARVSKLLEAVIGAQELERVRIAGEMHDGILQDLSALYLKAEMALVLLSRDDPQGAMENLEKLKDAITDEVNNIREFIMEVRPPSLDEIGLGPTVQDMVERLAKDNSLDGQFVDDLGDSRLPASLETILYRTAQEAVRNVAKHAQASKVLVALRRDGHEVVLTVTDDGRGIPEDIQSALKPGHFGIETMRERIELAGGQFKMSPGAKVGTVLEARVPG